MNEIKKEEMFGNLKNFLKSKGVELQEGSYTETIRRGCDILTDSVNLSQRAFDQARDKVGKGLDHLRQAVHERTAPKPTAAEAPKKAPARARAAKKKCATGKKDGSANSSRRKQ